jgi:hypothetical protein
VSATMKTTKADLIEANTILLQTNCTLSNEVYRLRQVRDELMLQLEIATRQRDAYARGDVKPLTRELISRTSEYHGKNTHH